MPRRSEQSINSLNVGSGLNIPTRKATINDLSQLPDNYCSTPGGTLFATTPGGTRIIYDRSFLLKMRNSPIASTPPKNLPFIAGVTTISPESCKENKLPALAKSPLVSKTIDPVKPEKRVTTNSSEEDSAKAPEITVNPNEEQFSMEM